MKLSEIVPDLHVYEQAWTASGKPEAEPPRLLRDILPKDTGTQIKCADLQDKQITIHGFRVNEQGKFGKAVILDVEFPVGSGKRYSLWRNADSPIGDIIRRVPPAAFAVNATVKKVRSEKNKRDYWTLE